jgi:hypothetical protein
VFDHAVAALSDRDYAQFWGWEMPYQDVRYRITANETDRVSDACERHPERLVVWRLSEEPYTMFGDIRDTLTPKQPVLP